MKRLSWIFILIVGYALSVSSQNISSVILQNGMPLTADQTLTLSDTCYFMSNKDMLWTLKLYHRDSNTKNTIEYLYTIKSDSIPTKTFVICGDLSDVDKSNKSRWKHYYQENDIDVLYKGILYVTDTTSGVVEEIPLNFNLLPSVPQIIDCYWHNIDCHPHPDDGFPTLITDSSYFEVSFIAKNEISHISLYYMALNFNIQGKENPDIRWQTLYYLYPSDFSHINDTISFAFPDREVDWGEYMQFSVSNQYGGSIWSDIICTTNYINDPLILNDINEFIRWWEEIGSSIEDITNDNLTSPQPINIVVDGDNLNLSISNGAINSSAIYDISGQLRLITNNSDLIDISILPQGVYFITCKTETNELLTSKFLKR